MWSAITAPQATIISALLTVAAAIIGVMLGWRLFGGRVADLQTALLTSEQLLRDHTSQVSEQLSHLREVFLDFDRQLTADLGQLKGAVGDLSEQNAAAVTIVETPAQAHEAELQADAREKLAASWALIRDKLEEIAARPGLDGRTKAKYYRIDRRNYAGLVDALADDGMLGSNEDALREAVSLWGTYRTGRKKPNLEDIARMSLIAARLS